MHSLHEVFMQAAEPKRLDLVQQQLASLAETTEPDSKLLICFRYHCTVHQYLTPMAALPLAAFPLHRCPKENTCSSTPNLLPLTWPIRQTSYQDYLFDILYFPHLQDCKF